RAEDQRDPPAAPPRPPPEPPAAPTATAQVPPFGFAPARYGPGRRVARPRPGPVPGAPGRPAILVSLRRLITGPGLVLVPATPILTHRPRHLYVEMPAMTTSR